MSEFNKGDLVTITDTRYGSDTDQLQPGQKAEVIELPDFDGDYEVKYRNNVGDMEVQYVHEDTVVAFVDEVDQAIEEVADMVNHPPHYVAHPSGVECIQITEHMGFTLGNAMKYIWRADLKNGVEDLKKAVWYIEREIAKRS